MKINKIHDNIRSSLASQSLASQLVFADVLEHDYRQTTVKSVLPSSTNPQTYLADYSSNFFTIKDEDNQLTRDLRFKDIFNKSAKLPSISSIDDLADDLTTDNKIDNESWRYHRKWLSVVFMIWFFLAVGLLLNAAYY
ncbi:hypothetical protein CYJ96_01775 [Moraxella osloensis]|uniref:Uncharacterized protein n=1 Tax=Faucicola osloensis TaxID=34062 RepID=A0A2I1RKL6_FAUOS|nr:hypothetical protein [Moraxella osloensis]PKZ69656.1 hypothetical protein CYJ96_01775 [Moraxella osloensis]